MTGRKWELVNLGELFKLKHGYAFKGEFFSDSGKYVLLTPGNFREDGGLQLKGEKEKYYIGEFPKDYILTAGTLVVVLTDLKQDAPILGSSAFIPESQKFLHNQRLGKVEKLNSQKVDIQFLYHLFNSQVVRGQIKGSATGSTVRHTSPERIYQVTVNLPHLPTQRKIASILSAYDRLIENNTRRIKILEEMAQMLYREWFINFRFPNHENVKMVESAIGLIPERWDVVKLGNHITTQKGYAFKSEWYQDYGVPIVKVSNFTDNSIDITNLVSISEEIAQQYKKYELKSNEIIIQTVGSWASNPQSVVGKVIRTPREAEGALLNQNAVKIFPQNSINLAFLFYCLKREEFKSYIVGCGQGAASQASITLDAIKAFEILLPSSNLLELFKKTIYTNWELINNLRVKNINLRKTRDLLLPKLISGEIDVENLDIETLEIAA